MPIWLVILNAGLVILAAATLRFGLKMSPGPTNDAAVLTFYGCLVALVAINVVALGYRHRAAIADFPPFRLIRLWFQAKERELRKRAGE